MYHRMSASEYGRVSATDLAGAVQRGSRLMRARMACEPAPGMVAYFDGDPAGWCGIGARAEFAPLQRSRTIPALHDRPIWSVVCFLVRPRYRRRGIAAALPAGAVDHARNATAPGLEGYPVDAGDDRVDATFAYVGTTGMFEAVAFRRVSETLSRSAGRPRWIMRLDL